jgi:general secretion pathway protein M
VSLQTRLDKLEPRERRLLTIFGSLVGAALFLAGPVGILSHVSGKRSENEELSALIDSIYEARAQVAERRAKKEAMLARYAKPAPALAGFLDEAAKANGLTAAESQDRPEAPHGKRYSERYTVLKLHKVGLAPLAGMIEQIEQSGYPVIVSKLSIKPRTGEPDSYEVELGVSAYDRKSDKSAPGGASSAHPAASGKPSASAEPAAEKGKEKDKDKEKKP